MEKKIMPQFHLYTSYEEIKRDGNGERDMPTIGTF